MKTMMRQYWVLWWSHGIINKLRCESLETSQETIRNLQARGWNPIVISGLDMQEL